MSANYRLGSNWIVVGRIKIFVVRWKVTISAHARTHAHAETTRTSLGEEGQSITGEIAWRLLVDAKRYRQDLLSRPGRGRYHWLASLPTPLISLGASSNWQSKILSRASFRIVNRLICVMRWINGRQYDRELGMAKFYANRDDDGLKIGLFNSKDIIW